MKTKILIIRDVDYKRLRRIWNGMKQRCKPLPGNKNYGLRGVRVCDEWYNSFNDFAVWAIQNHYKHYHSIDRIDVNGNYEPSNCRWSTPTEQAQNTRPRSLWDSKYKRKYGMHAWEIAKKLNKGIQHIYSKHRRGELEYILKNYV